MSQIIQFKPKRKSTNETIKALHLLRHPFTTVNYSRMLDGVVKAKDAKIVIAGCCRDVNHDILNRNLAKCKKLGSNFLDYQIIVFENDSQQPIISTDEKIHTVNKTFGYKLLGQGRDYRRVKLMAQFRNEYFKLIQEKYSDFDYVLIVDYDLTEWRLDGIFNSLGYDDELWDMIGANGIQITSENKELYYDTFALIDTNMGLYEIGAVVPIFDIEKGLWKTFACFGGIALYRMEAFLESGGYSVCHVNKKICSEQCSICMHMNIAGFDKIYVNPSMVVLR